MEFNQKTIEEGLNLALSIARERTIVLEALKQALVEDNNEKVKLYARELCGLANESHRIS
jgi:hypothetical protein